MTPVVLVVGHSAAGKTTVARAASAAFGLPVVAKDRIKERMLDALGTGDRAWSRRVGIAAFDLLDDMIELQLAGGAPFLVDANFDADVAGGRFAAWHRRFDRDWIQVRCTAPDDVLLQRYSRRAASGERHPGHGDHEGAEEFLASLRRRRRETFDLPGTLIEVDTTTTGPADVVERLQRFMV